MNGVLTDSPVKMSPVKKSTERLTVNLSQNMTEVNKKKVVLISKYHKNDNEEKL